MTVGELAELVVGGLATGDLAGSDLVAVQIDGDVYAITGNTIDSGGVGRTRLVLLPEEQLR